MDRSQAGVIVVGGGIVGLTCAFWLARGGLDVLLLERDAVPGGCIRTLREGGWVFDQGPNTLGFAEGDVSRLCDAAGLRDRLRDPGDAAKARFVQDPRRARERDTALTPIPSSPLGLVTTPLLSLRGKVRALREPFIAPLEGDAEESIAGFVRRRLGKEVLEGLVFPFVSGVAAGDPECLSLRWAMPSLHALEAKHGSLVRGMFALRKEGMASPRPVSFEEGLDELPRALATALGDRLRLSAGVSRIGWSPAGFDVEIGDSQRYRAPRLVLAAPAAEAARLLAGIYEAPAALASVVYAPVVSIALGFEARALRSTPAGFGYLAGRGASQALAGCLYTSSLFPGRAPAGHVGLTILAGGTAHREVIDWTEDRLLGVVMDDLRRGLGPLPDPVFRRVTRWPRAIPQYNLGYGRVVREAREFERSFPGLHLAGAYLGGISLADCIGSASHLARTLLEETIGERKETGSGGGRH